MLQPLHKPSQKKNRFLSKFHRSKIRKRPNYIDQFFCCLSLWLILLLSSCDFNSSREVRHQKGEYIRRQSHEKLLFPEALSKKQSQYPWEKGGYLYSEITKEHFRCKGRDSHPSKTIEHQGKSTVIYDCGGIDQHSLPLRDQKEFIYPILIDLLNYVQKKTHRRVIVTAGHRCPDHQRYNNASPKEQYSKHQIGAEVTFYVQGLENQPEIPIHFLQGYFQEIKRYSGQKEFLEFQRWVRKNSDVSTPPWYNKEVFIKLYQKNEGRDFDNSHDHPYIAIQVRWDSELNERVNYSWDRAFRNYWRK